MSFGGRNPNHQGTSTLAFQQNRTDNEHRLCLSHKPNLIQSRADPKRASTKNEKRIRKSNPLIQTEKQELFRRYSMQFRITSLNCTNDFGNADIAASAHIREITQPARQERQAARLPESRPEEWLREPPSQAPAPEEPWHPWQYPNCSRQPDRGPSSS